MRIRWYDWLVYRLFYWRWGPILTRNPTMREVLIVWLKCFDVLDDGEKITVIVQRDNF